MSNYGDFKYFFDMGAQQIYRGSGNGAEANAGFSNNIYAGLQQSATTAGLQGQADAMQIGPEQAGNIQNQQNQLSQLGQLSADQLLLLSALQDKQAQQNQSTPKSSFNGGTYWQQPFIYPKPKQQEAYSDGSENTRKIEL